MNYCKEKLCYENIIDLYKKGCKTDQTIGMEYERIPINAKTNENVSYYGLFGVRELLKEFAEIDNWDYILDDEEIIGLKKLHDTITLEPGSQIELSVVPQKNVVDLEKHIKEIDKNLSELLKKYEIKLLNYGVAPKTTYKNIDLIPKRRYKYMANYLWGILSDVMMKETAGIQVGIDFESEEDAMEKLYTANILSPFMTAMFANSKYRGGVDTGYKSFRALSWLNTDNERCGFLTKLKKDLYFKDYVDNILDTPMIFIMRNDKLIYIDGKITFRKFMQDGFESYDASIKDYQLHENMIFPEVRLRNFIEIRNHDCVGNGLEYSIPAIYKSIMYNKDAMQSVQNLIGELSNNDIEEFRYCIPRLALQTKIKNYTAKDIALEILNIASYSLKNDIDSKYLEPIIELTKKGLSPSDINDICI